jgi:hypothetical protein
VFHYFTLISLQCFINGVPLLYSDSLHCCVNDVLLLYCDSLHCCVNGVQILYCDILQCCIDGVPLLNCDSYIVLCVVFHYLTVIVYTSTFRGVLLVVCNDLLGQSALFYLWCSNA